MKNPREVEFRKAGGRLVAFAEISADVETPVSAFLKIRRPPYGFLFESVEGGERVGRYSFLGSGATTTFSARGKVLLETRNGVTKATAGNPLDLLARRFPSRPTLVPGLPRFEGGLVGYVGYDAVRYMERLPKPPRDDRGLPDLFFMLADTVLVFDHVRHTIMLIASADLRQGRAHAAAEARARLEAEAERLTRPLPPSPILVIRPGRVPDHVVNMSRDAFLRNVERAKGFIRIGDIIQVVLSQRFDAPYSGDPFMLYRSLRVLNPSPYMFYLDCDGVTLAGSSPEMLVRVEGDQVETRPIAGTRPRGKRPEDDARLERELLADPKERAEHVMLVDLGRNDLGRVCRYGTVKVADFMSVERYSHVMHIVTGIKGRLKAGQGAFDVLRACFPAGTVSGAPKVRAMEIIDAIEPVRRGPYAGAAGYVSFSGNMDTAIAIRTIVVARGRAYVQSGMGIVADSRPASEYAESMAKARAALLAVAAAEESR
jgi:anthranilate synthase component 1